MKRLYTYAIMSCMLTALTACDGEVDASYPVILEQERLAKRGKLTGDGLSILGGPDDNAATSGLSPIGVNAFLWRATLDTINFMPLASADPFGGVIITDWYADPAEPMQRYKLNVLILDTSLRADGVKVSVFKQGYNGADWQDMAVDDGTGRKIEDAILTRARSLRMQSASAG